MDTSGESIANAIAAAVGGSAEMLQTDRDTRIVRLADGRAPVLVRDFGHAVGACVDGIRAGGGIARKCRTTEPFEAQVQEVAAGVETWSRSKKTAGRLTLFAMVPEMTSLLGDVFEERWTASFPGVSVPEEAWFHGVDFDAASVGIVRGRISMTIAGEFVLLPVATQDEWLAVRRQVVAGVRAQRRSYDKFVALSGHLAAQAEGLRSRLEARLGREVLVRPSMRPTHAAGARCTIESKGSVLAQLEIVDGAVMLSAGASGEAGWRGAIVDFDPALSLAAVWPQVLAAVERARDVLDLRSLKRGRCYRVLESLQGLSRGALVTFVGFVDIDNHYGSYDFKDASGAVVSVTGDFSSPERHPFAATYRYLDFVRTG